MKKHESSFDRTSRVWVEAVPTDETRSEDGEQKILRLRGYAILFNSESERMGSIVETIDPKALDSLGDLNKQDVRLQGEHKNIALARTTNESLKLVKDSKGILIEADLDARRSDSRDLYYAVERGDISQMSFGFRIAKNGETLTEQADGTLRAHVTTIEKLYEVSAVTFPAYSKTTLEAVDTTPINETETDEPINAHVEDRSWSVDIKRRKTMLD